MRTEAATIRGSTAIRPSANQEPDRMSTFFPATVLTFIGAILAFLGLFAAGDLALIALGVTAVFGAGVIVVLGQAVGRKDA
jgi:hypothetical protein